jgi:hypothetical protein
MNNIGGIVYSQKIQLLLTLMVKILLKWGNDASELRSYQFSAWKCLATLKVVYCAAFRFREFYSRY